MSYRLFYSKLFHNKGFDILAKQITSGVTEVNPCFTPEYLAGQYAYWMATESPNINLNVIKGELRFLKEIGAVFDRDQALEEAIKFREIMQIENSKAIWV